MRHVDKTVSYLNTPVFDLKAEVVAQYEWYHHKESKTYSSKIGHSQLKEILLSIVESDIKELC